MQVRANWKTWAIALVVIVAAIAVVLYFLAEPTPPLKPPVPTADLETSQSYTRQPAQPQPVSPDQSSTPSPTASGPETLLPVEGVVPSTSTLPATNAQKPAPVTGQWVVAGDDAQAETPATEAPSTRVLPEPSGQTAPSSTPVTKPDTTKASSQLSPATKAAPSSRESDGNGKDGLRVKVHKNDAASERSKSPTPSPAPASSRPAHICYFGFDRSQLDQAERERLVAFLASLGGQRVAGLRVDGFTCSIGTTAYNQNLSERRAATVGRLIDQIVALPAGSVTAQGFGEDWPAFSNATREGRRKNRRVEIYVAMHTAQATDQPSAPPSPASSPASAPEPLSPATNASPVREASAQTIPSPDAAPANTSPVRIPDSIPQFTSLPALYSDADCPRTCWQASAHPSLLLAGQVIATAQSPRESAPMPLIFRTPLIPLAPAYPAERAERPFAGEYVASTSSAIRSAASYATAPAAITLRRQIAGELMPVLTRQMAKSPARGQLSPVIEFT